MVGRFINRQQSGSGAANEGRSFLPKLSGSTKRMLIATLVIVGLFVVATVTAPFWINWIWFGDMGYRGVLVQRYVAQIVSFLVVGALSAAIFYVNVSMALRNTREESGSVGTISAWSRRLLRGLIVGTTMIVFTVCGFAGARHWEDNLLAVRGPSFGVDDPTFGRDVGFYIFALPVMDGVQDGLLRLVAVTAVAAAVIYFVRLGVRFRSLEDVPWTALRHVSGLAAALLLITALGYWLRNFDLVFSQRGVVFGPGFTDVNIVRPLNYLMALASAAAGILILTGTVLRSPKYLVGVLGGWLALAAVVSPLLPPLVQRAVVNPNEFRREEQYIERNIEMTREAFGLGGVDVQELTGQDEIDVDALSVDEPPLRNVRIWDYRVVQPIYEQLQTFVPYYEFGDIDVDRYEIDGVPTQVMLSARELDVAGLPENAQTWTNRHLAYTHGYGAVVSPVSDVSSEGWPTFLVSQIPPQGPDELAITQPEIYFGEAPTDWVIIHTNQSEFSGLVENEDEEAIGGHEGDVHGGVGLGNPVTRGMAALTLGDRNVFLSGQLTGDSELLMWRSVVDRAERIAPFLSYDPDPYLVIADGRLVWVIDAYTTSNDFPSATRYDGVNYLRNSVKVTVDAYTGETTFYRTAMTDPIADAWERVYPDLFTPVEDAPGSVASHFRYPELQFQMQSDVWAEYHVTSARSFYDGDDLWTVAEDSVDGNLVDVEPYFVTQALPGEDSTVFALTVPFTPGGQQNRQNMTAWMAGTADETGATNLRLYRYPRQVTVDGPRQIDAQINQDPLIAQQITLWNQSGSEVISGNLLVIPVNDSMLYVQPLYLRAAASTAAAPQLAAVIVATNDELVMEPTLEEAIASLEGAAASAEAPVDAEDEGIEAPAEPEVTGVPDDLSLLTEAQLLDEAVATFDRGQAALADGNWATYGDEQERLETILNLLSANGAAPVATPES
ncbi:UPF0182 family protein [soil metagenome]|jgi:uncharacterized membrane protein (UPF0182 family)